MEQSLQPLVSVITPVYNGARYLRECIESVIAQTYTNWRYTICDNCSTDDSLEIARHYARLDPRIRVCASTDFLPIIDNHNRAIGCLDPDSTYCKPLMADDWLYPECIEKLVASAQARPSVGLVCSYAVSGKVVIYGGLKCTAGTTTYLTGREAGRRALLDNVYFFGSPTTMLIRSSLIRDRKPFYDPQSLHADEVSCYDMLRECDFAFSHHVLSFNREHEESQTTKVAGLESIFVGRIYALWKYGRDYLGAEEFEQRYRQRFNEYYSLLASHALRLRGGDFWKYHRGKLAQFGAPLNRLRVLRAMIVRVAHSILTPVEVAWAWCPVAYREWLRRRRAT